MKLLIQFPTRSRPQKALNVGREYAGMLSGLHDVTLCFTVDDNDPTITESFVADCNEIDAEMKSGSFRVVVNIGSHSGKVSAVNDIPDKVTLGNVNPTLHKWDVCLVASDDMIPKEQGYDNVIAMEMEQRYPDLDGSLWFNDGYVEKRLNTIICVGRKYYDRFGYLYHPSYKSMWADNEFTEIGTMLSRQTYFDRVIIKHEHPVNTGGPKDDLYVRNDEPWQVDYRTYLSRKSARFDLPLLSILICTLPSRRHKFERVSTNIMSQISRGTFESNVFVLSDPTEGISIGEKRNRLMSRAKGEYVCFVDDDDDVSPDYVALLVSAIGNCDVDAVGLRGSIMMQAGQWKRFEHDLKHCEYTSNQDGTMYHRPPNHLNPVRRAIASRYEFIDASRSEDTDYAMRMCREGAIRSCRMAAEHPIYYYIPSEMQNAAEVPSTEGAAQATSDSPNKPVLPINMKTSTWRREGPRRPRR